MPRRGLMLAVLPDHDLPTRYAKEYLRDAVERSGAERLWLLGPACTRGNVEAALMEADPGIVVAEGHGLPGELMGHGDEPVLVACDNDRLLAGRWAYLLSCSTGEELGPSMVRKGAVCYLGYSKPFIFLYQIEPPEDPREDRYARSFLGPASEPAYVLGAGGDGAQAYRSAAEGMRREVERWMSSDDPAAGDAIKFLLHDVEALTLIGDAAAPTRAPLRGLLSPVAAASLAIGLALMWGAGRG